MLLLIEKLFYIVHWTLLFALIGVFQIIIQHTKMNVQEKVWNDTKKIGYWAKAQNFEYWKKYLFDFKNIV